MNDKNKKNQLLSLVGISILRDIIVSHTFPDISYKILLKNAKEYFKIHPSKIDKPLNFKRYHL